MQEILYYRMNPFLILCFFVSVDYRNVYASIPHYIADQQNFYVQISKRIFNITDKNCSIFF